MSISHNWSEAGLEVLFPPSLLEGLKDSIEFLADFIITSLEGLSAAYALGATYLTDFTGEAEIIDAILEEINDLISALLDLGVSTIWYLPSLGNPKSVEEIMGLMADSVVDLYDPGRPISFGETADAAFVFFTGRAATFDSLEALSRALAVIFDVSIFDLFTLSVAVNSPHQFQGGQGTPPDWNPGKVLTEFPHLYNILLSLQQITSAFAGPSVAGSFLADLAEALQAKADVLQAVADEFSAAVDAYLAALDFQDLITVVVAGTGTAEEFSAEIRASIQTMPGAFVSDNIGVVAGAAAVGATAPDTLLSILAGDRPVVQ